MTITSDLPVLMLKYIKKRVIIMADCMTKEQRSRNMSHIKSKDTSIELKVRKYLYHHGFRYRKNDKTLPGTPDIVLSKYRTVIFINGCFWHHHFNCKYATLPKTRQDYWLKKINKNVENDLKHYKELEQIDYKVIVPWKCVAAGNDIIMPGNPDDDKNIRQAYKEGKLTEEEIRNCAGHLVSMIRRLESTDC